MIKKTLLASSVLLSALALQAATVVDVTGTGVQKTAVEIHVANPAYAKCLQRNLELSGLFQVSGSGSVRITGSSGAVFAQGNGKSVSSGETFADDKSARKAARAFSDALVEAFTDGRQKGFARDKILFLRCGKATKRGAARPSEICLGYADGFDVRQLTSDAKMTIFPRWAGDGDSIFYISDRNGAPQIWSMNTATGQRKMRWSFKGTPTSIVPSPDGSKFAACLSYQGNVELYVLMPSADKIIRLTTTPLASEGQPTWSPDGRQIAYVSDETRHPQIYVIDVATKQKRRLTSRGMQNTDPDWGKDGRIAYISGGLVAVMPAASGDASREIVTDGGGWEHPSWSRDGRHLVANCGGGLRIVDTLKDGDKPRIVPIQSGNWISPTWVK